MKFDEFNLDTHLLMSLYENDYYEATTIQGKIIPEILSGNNIIGRSETGSGKTLAFLIPILNKLDMDSFGVQALIICPTRELSFQVAEEAKKLSKSFDENIKIATLNGGMNFDEQRRILKKGAKIVVGTVGRIEEHIQEKSLKLDNLRTLCLDEADEMLTLGFKADVDYIFSVCPKSTQLLLFSATFSAQIREIIKKFVYKPVYIEIGKDTTTVDTITQYYIFKKDKVGLLKDLVRSYGNRKILIFANTKSKVEELYKEIKHLDKVAYIHGDIMQNERHKSMQDFKKGKTNVLIATDVASRGIDVTDIYMVINFELPMELEYYIHRVGRTARAGKNGIALTIVHNKVSNRKIIELAEILGTEIKEMVLVDDKLYESTNTYTPKDKPSGLWEKPKKKNNNISNSKSMVQKNKIVSKNDKKQNAKNDKRYNTARTKKQPDNKNSNGRKPKNHKAVNSKNNNRNNKKFR